MSLESEPDILSEELSEKCGIFGVYNGSLEVSRLVHSGLFALQHRGQESTGIASSNGENIFIHKGMGLVSHVYDDEDFKDLPGFIAIGHNRYSTSEGSSLNHAQPVVRDDMILALAHNGNLPSTTQLTEFLIDKGIGTKGSNDSELMTDVLNYYLRRGKSLEEAIQESYHLFTGAFSLLVMTRDKLVALRDPCGIRPLSIGKLDDGYVFSSETCALDVIQASFLREVNPGEMVVVDKEGIKSFQIAEADQKLDIFEFVYFARPDSRILGKSVNEIRRNFGITLAIESPVDADVVIPVPDSAIPAALGFAQESGIPFDFGLIKNRYIHRTFIRPEQRLRERDVEMKLNPISEIISDKRVVLIDDSIVRGTTLAKLVQMLRKAGAKEVHVRISSPPVRYPDFYGIDTPDQKKLIAAEKTVDEIKEYIGADTLAYLSYEGMITATGLPEDVFSTSCFTGIYPIDIKEREGEIVRFPKV